MGIFTAIVAMLGLTACAAGSAVVTGQTRDPVAPDQVKIYLDPPAAFESIGLVSASSEAGWTQQGSMDSAIAELKRQAAKLGANGVLIGATGGTTETVSDAYGHLYPISGKTVQGRAMFVKAQ